MTLEQINKYMDTYITPEIIEVNYDDYFNLKVKTKLTLSEKNKFIENVIDNAYINHTIPSRTNLEAAFKIEFLRTCCVDVELPTIDIDDETVIDSQRSCDIFDFLEIHENLRSKEYGDIIMFYLSELKRDVEERFTHNNAKLVAYVGMSTANTEAIETFSLTMNKIVDLLNVAMDQIDKNGNRLFENLTPNRINKFMINIQKSIVDSLKSKNDEIKSGFNIVKGGVNN